MSLGRKNVVFTNEEMMRPFAFIIVGWWLIGSRTFDIESVITLATRNGVVT